MKTINKLFLSIAIVILSATFLSGCGSKKTTSNVPTPTPEPKAFELKDEEKPYLSLIPTADGHNLKMKIEKLPSYITDIEYELLYTASDNGLEVEKGVGDSIKIDSTSLERDILLGTASCTAGCKYKYDEGVRSGSLTLTLITKDGGAATVSTDFVITTTADIKKNSGIEFKSDSYKLPLTGSLSGTDYYVMLKNNKQYSVFTSGSTKNSLIGDHQIAN